jgi:hypothetical protein
MSSTGGFGTAVVVVVDVLVVEVGAVVEVGVVLGVGAVLDVVVLVVSTPDATVAGPTGADAGSAESSPPHDTVARTASNIGPISLWTPTLRGA